ncbi:MAG TPA: MFS transporter [Pseudonocardiaceae bacterium]|jgi:CP family cyanate transporter-like MFS transporter|nr:MFS transporter [Pseudonocardiaceae bacterium]
MSGPTNARSRDEWLLVAALLLAGLSMRTAVTSVGAVLGAIETGLHSNSGVAGLITTLPAICFAVLGALTPRMAARAGQHRLLVIALGTMTVGLVARAVVGSVWLFLVLSVLSLAGGAVANVVMPALVKAHFPNRIGRMTAVYTTALAVGTTAGAGVTVPIANLVGGPDSWRTGIGSWALLSVVAMLAWVPTVKHDTAVSTGPRRLSPRTLMRSPVAWRVTMFFAFQSVQAYVAFGWFERFLTAHGIGDVTAGWMVALLTAMGIPVSMIVPIVPMRYHRLVVLVLGGCYGAAYAGLGLAPAGGAWLWMVLAGIGSGMFPFSLVLMGYRSTGSATTASLSAFAQGVGYVIAACGPLLFGVLHGATGGWAASLVVLWVALVIATVAGWLACARRTVDDDLAARATAVA